MTDTAKLAAAANELLINRRRMLATSAGALSPALRSTPIPAPSAPRCGVGDQGGRHAVHAAIGHRNYVVRLR